jgi:uncharacterized protein YndB with AHSA1/START domain
MTAGKDDDGPDETTNGEDGAMHAGTETQDAAADRELVLTRDFDAPREVVFDAWTDPAQVGAWWGPRGFTTTVYEMDVRPGGVWRYMMHGPDGTDYPNRVVYVEIARPERLVYEHGDDGGEWNPFHVTVTFEDRGGRTRLVSRMVFPTAAMAAEARRFGALELGNQTMERLAEHLAAR